MMIRVFPYFTILISVLLSGSGYTQCSIDSTFDLKNEKLNYQVYYNYGIVWLNAGTSTFEVKDTTIKDSTYWHLIATGSTLKKYDWIFKVRDKYESIVSKDNLSPIFHERKVREGKTRIHNIYKIDQNIAHFSLQNGDETPKLDSLNVPNCTYDVLSAIYNCRNIDFKNAKINDSISVNFILEGEFYPSYFRYLGKEKFQLKNGKEISCHVIRPNLIEGTIFKGGEKMTVWVTDDPQKTPVYIESEILIGSIKVYLNDTNKTDNPALKPEDPSMQN